MPQALDEPNQIIPVLAPAGTFPMVGMTAAQVIGPNPNRLSLFFANPGTQIIYLAPLGPPIVAGQGLPLYPDDTLSFVADGNFRITCGWQAVAGSGTSNNLTVLESPAPPGFVPPPPPSGTFNPSPFVPTVL
jgi:hypothetical protein